MLGLFPTPANHTPLVDVPTRVIKSSPSTRALPEHVHVFFFQDQFPRLRFGVAVSKCRSRFDKKHKRIAKEFLRQARATDNHFDARPKENRAWINGGDLQPVIDYLSAQVH